MTDLELIRVESTGLLDVVYLKHTGQRIFTLRCKLHGSSSRLRISANFYPSDDLMWDDVFSTYIHWKRTKMPGFKLGRHSGRMRDGARHPFRSFPRPGGKPGRKWSDLGAEEFRSAPEEPPPRPEMPD